MTKIKFIFLYFFKKSQTHPWWFLLICFAMLVFGILNVKKLHYRLSASDLIDTHMQSTLDLLELKENFKIKPSAFAIIKASDEQAGFTKESLCSIQNAFFEIQSQFPEIADIFSGLNIRLPKFIDQKLWYPKIIDPCKTHADATLSVLSDSPWNMILTNKGATNLVAQFSLYPLVPPGKFGQVDVTLFDKMVEALSEKIKMPINWSGELTFNSFFLKGIKRTQILNLSAIILIFLLFRLLYGTFRSGSIFVFTIIVTNIFIHGCMGFFHHDINPLTSGIFFLILISALEDFIFISGPNIADEIKLKEGKFLATSSRRWRKGFRKILIPGFFTSLTTAIGFISLCVSDLEVIQQFGLWTSLGALTEWFVTFFILPALLCKIPFFRNWIRYEKSIKALHHFNFSKVKIKKRLVVILIALMPIAVYLGNQIKLNYSPLDMFPKGHLMHQFTNDLLKEHGWISEMSLVFLDGTSRDEILTILNQVKKLPNVSLIESPEEIFNYATKNMNQLFKDLIFMEVSRSQQWKRLQKEYGPSRAILYISKIDVESIIQLNNQVSSICKTRKTCFLAGDLLAFSDFSRQILNTLFESLAMSIFLVVLILIVLARLMKCKQIWQLVLSTLWGPSILLALISVSEISINIVSSVILSIIVGLTGDNAVQYLFSSQKKSLDFGVDKVGLTSIYCSGIMSLTSLILLGSYFQPVRHLGLLLSFALLLSLFGDLWLLKGMLLFSKEKNPPQPGPN